METLALSLVGGAFAGIIAVVLMYLGPTKGGGITAFLVIIGLTFFLPFYAYLLLVFFKPVVDSLYAVRFGPLKITQAFSVYSITIWGIFLFLKRALRRPITYLDSAHILLLAPVPFILLFSPNIKGLDLSLRLLSGWGFYFMAREIDLRNARWIEMAFLFSALFPTVMGVLALSGYLPNGFQEGSFERLKGPYHDATAFGFELVPGFLFLLHRLGRRFNPLEFVLIVIMVFLFYKTYTRALWASVFLASMVVAFRREAKGRRLAPVLLFALVLGGVIYFYPEISERFSHHGLGTDPESFNGRMLIWSEGFRRFLSLHPIAMFFGLITTGKPIGLYLHNTYLTFLIDMGFFGFTVFMLWLLNVTRFVLSCKGEYSGLLRAAFFFVVISGITSGGVLYPNFQWFFLTVLGLAMNDHVSRRAKERQRTEEKEYGDGGAFSRCEGCP